MEREEKQRLVWIEAKNTAKKEGVCRVLLGLLHGVGRSREALGDGRYKAVLPTPVPISSDLYVPSVIEDERGEIVDLMLLAGGMELGWISSMQYSLRSTTVLAEYESDRYVYSIVQGATDVPATIVVTIGDRRSPSRVGGLLMTVSGWSISFEKGKIVMRHALISDVTIADHPVRYVERAEGSPQQIVTATGSHFPFDYKLKR